MSTKGSSIDQVLQNQEAPHAGRLRFGVWLLPLAILLGFALVFGLLFRDRLLPAKEVTVFTALAVEEKIEGGARREKPAAGAGELLFQASGWVEPDPLPIKATALTDGIVDEVHVLEGELVKKGDLLATLIDDDRRIERDLVAAELADIKASFDAHCVGTQIQIQKMEAEKAALAVAEADAAEAENKLRRYERLAKGSITEDERITVRFDHDRSLAMVKAAKARIAEIAENLNRIAYEVVAIQSRIRAAEANLEKAELALSRTKIHAPFDGRVLALKAAPGQKKMIGMDEEDSSTIAILYDPQHLQVRVDVPLADAARLGVGQVAKIRCNLLPDQVFDGLVTRIEGAADLQRNTLQAKVRIENPSEKFRPEMLCRVEFFEIPTSPQATGNAVQDDTGISIYVPQEAISGGSVWVCDPDTMRAERREVSASVKRENLIRIDEGILPGEWVIVEPDGVKAGQRLKPIFKEKS
ncbi:MAG: efflux RND transporter periplasmic adaptor subunit [Luteolibacter sp.]